MSFSGGRWLASVCTADVVYGDIKTWLHQQLSGRHDTARYNPVSMGYWSATGTACQHQSVGLWPSRRQRWFQIVVSEARCAMSSIRRHQRTTSCQKFHCVVLLCYNTAIVCVCVCVCACVCDNLSLFRAFRLVVSDPQAIGEGIYPYGDF